MILDKQPFKSPAPNTRQNETGWMKAVGNIWRAVCWFHKDLSSMNISTRELTTKSHFLKIRNLYVPFPKSLQVSDLLQINVMQSFLTAKHKLKKACSKRLCFFILGLLHWHTSYLLQGGGSYHLRPCFKTEIGLYLPSLLSNLLQLKQYLPESSIKLCFFPYNLRFTALHKLHFIWVVMESCPWKRLFTIFSLLLFGAFCLRSIRLNYLFHNATCDNHDGNTWAIIFFIFFT